MQTRRRLLVATALISIGLTACANSDAEPVSIDLHVTGEAPPEPRTEEVGRGAEVTLKVTSDVTDRLHVHGFEKTLDLTPGGEQELVFTADMAGRFEIETHQDPAIWIKLVVK